MIFLRRARHVASIVTLLGTIAALFGYGSQQILEARQAVPVEQQNKTPGNADVSAQPQQPAPPTRVTVDGTVTVVNQPDPKQQERDAEQRAQTQFDNWIDVLTLLLLAVAAGGAVGAYRANRRSANAAVAALAETRKAANEAKRTADLADLAMRVNERAYLALSHRPPGIVIEPAIIPGPGDAKQNVFVRIGVKNLGNTPANVTYVLIHLFITNQPLPVFPPYDETVGLRRLWINVVKTDDFTMTQHHPMDLSAIDEIRRGDLQLYALGYADYIDKFGVRHRCGYARAYNPSEDDPRRYMNDDGTINQKAAAKRSNLPFVTEPNYNYDRERKKGEGKDWDEAV